MGAVDPDLRLAAVTAALSPGRHRTTRRCPDWRNLRRSTWAIMAAQGERFDLLLGRRTYDTWSGFWPKAPSSPMADGLNAATKCSTLTSTLLEHGLADEVLLAVHPVLLGTGKRFFAEGTPPRSFELVSTKAFPSGIIFSTYKVAGPLKTG